MNTTLAIGPSLAGLLLASSVATAGWEVFPNAPNIEGPFSKLDDVEFVNDSGWTVNGLGEIYKTTNGGANWSLQQNFDVFLRSIKFANENVGYAGSLEGNFGSGDSEARIYKTTNGGTSWTNLTSAISPAPIGVCGLSVVNEEVVYGSGAFYSPARVYKTIDGGSSWTNFDMSAHASSLVDIHFTTPDVGFVVGLSNTFNGGVILRTTDGGSSWTTVHNTMVASDLIWKIQQLDSTHLYASVAGVSTTEGARILLSSDSGLTWQTKTVDPGEVHLQGVGFLTPSHGFAGGFFSGVYETTDGGDNWTLLNVGANFNRFQRISETKMIASGHSIYKYEVDGPSSAPPVNEILTQSLYSLDVYPNPTDGPLQIQYRVAQSTHVSLGLYAPSGQRLRTFHSGGQESGTYHVSGLLDGLAPGVYLVALLTREGDAIQKVIVR